MPLTESAATKVVEQRAIKFKSQCSLLGDVTIYGVAGELLIPVRVVGALITFLTYLTYLLTFVFGGVVTMLLYAGSSRSQNRQRGTRANAKQTSRFAERLVDSTDWKNPHERFEPGKEVVS